ncbi:MAG TPA: hypothetical protein VEY69_16230 [Lautropia sp.]|nr:hypothetical protein [Lautropia sp.]
MSSIVSGGAERSVEAADLPLSDKVAEGWEVSQYSASLGDSGLMEHCFYLRRGREHGVLRVRSKMMGRGLHSDWVLL